MKNLIMTLALTLLTASNAFAGAYGLSCKTDNPSVKIGKGYVTVNGKAYLYYAEVEGLIGTISVVDFLKEKEPKVVVSDPDVPTDIAQGGAQVIKEKNFKDECGNDGTTTKFKSAVGIYNSDGSTLVPVVRIVCEQTIISGHCI